LGVGIARYLSGQVNWSSFLLGLAWIVLIMLGFQYLNEYLSPDNVNNDHRWWHTPFSGSSGALGIGRLSRQVALWAGLICLTISASFTVLLYQNQELNLVSTLLLGLILIGELVFSLPPLRLATSGYGEVIMAIIISGFIPAMAFVLQVHEMHRILIMVSFPLAILYLGMLLALEVPAYASDINHGRRPVMVRIGWQKGMMLHNILVLSSFAIFGVAFVFGLPLSVGWPVLIVLPVGIFQIWMMNRIADGAKPNWNLLILIAFSSFCLTTYLLTFSFWTY
jgi:1,4-dihydroxy-2-naphthoate octaprenyltransferase